MQCGREEDAGIHDRPEPQLEGQGRSDGADRRDRAGTVCQGGTRRSGKTGGTTGRVPAGGSGGRVSRSVLAGRSAITAGVASAERLVAGPDGGSPRRRLCGKDFRRAQGEECRWLQFVCLGNVFCRREKFFTFFTERCESIRGIALL